VTFWSEVFLGVIAVATLLMAVIQAGTAVYGWTMLRRLDRIVSQVERDLKPLVESVNAIARDTARISSVTAGQVQRIDRLVSDLTTRVDETATTLQSAILRPLRDGAAMLSAVKAVIDLVREFPRRPAGSPTRPDDEDSLFIG
jgi:uncharacterized protein YoxC